MQHGRRCWHPSVQPCCGELTIGAWPALLRRRGADGGPWRMICALPALWVGLIYDPQVRRLVVGSCPAAGLGQQQQRKFPITCCWAGAAIAPWHPPPHPPAATAPLPLAPTTPPRRRLQAQAEALDLISDWTSAERDYLRAEVPRLGLDTPFRGGTVRTVAAKAGPRGMVGLERGAAGAATWLELAACWRTRPSNSPCPCPQVLDIASGGLERRGYDEVHFLRQLQVGWAAERQLPRCKGCSDFPAGCRPGRVVCRWLLGRAQVSRQSQAGAQGDFRARSLLPDRSRHGWLLSRVRRTLWRAARRPPTRCWTCTTRAGTSRWTPCLTNSCTDD